MCFLFPFDCPPERLHVVGGKPTATTSVYHKALMTVNMQNAPTTTMLNNPVGTSAFTLYPGVLSPITPSLAMATDINKPTYALGTWFQWANTLSPVNGIININSQFGLFDPYCILGNPAVLPGPVPYAGWPAGYGIVGGVLGNPIAGTAFKTFASGRLIAAGLRVTHAGGTVDNAGLLRGAHLYSGSATTAEGRTSNPGTVGNDADGMWGRTSGIFNTLGEVDQRPNTVFAPTSDGITAIYKPVDSDSFAFRSIEDMITASSFSNQTGTAWVNSQGGTVDYGALVVYGTSLSLGTTLLVECVCHYELADPTFGAQFATVSDGVLETTDMDRIQEVLDAVPQAFSTRSHLTMMSAAFGIPTSHVSSMARAAKMGVNCAAPSRRDPVGAMDRSSRARPAAAAAAAAATTMDVDAEGYCFAEPQDITDVERGFVAATGATKGTLVTSANGDEYAIFADGTIKRVMPGPGPSDQGATALGTPAKRTA